MERSIKELLKLMLDNQDRFTAGLCSWATDLFMRSKMTGAEWEMLIDYIENNRPSKYSSLSAYRSRNSLFYWKISDLKPRIKWIKKHIKKLS